MKIQVVHDTELGKTQITLLGQVQYGVNDTPAEDGSKLIVFGDNKVDVIIPVQREVAHDMSDRLVLHPVRRVETANAADLAAIRNGDKPHGS